MYYWKKSRAGKDLENFVESKGSCVFGQWSFPFFCQNCLFCLHTPSLECLLVPMGLLSPSSHDSHTTTYCFPKSPVPFLPNLCPYHDILALASAARWVKRWSSTKPGSPGDPGQELSRLPSLLLAEGVAGISSRAWQQQLASNECISHHECAVDSGFSRRLSMEQRSAVELEYIRILCPKVPTEIIVKHEGLFIHSYQHKGYWHTCIK